MRIKQKKWMLPALCGILAAGVIGGAWALLGSKGAESAVVSAGLQQLADDTYLACSAAGDGPITVTPEWLDHTLQGGAVTSITVTTLPPITDGVLKLGHGEVKVGQVIPRETLSYLAFYPNDGVKESSFSFVPTTKDGTAGYAVECRLTRRSETNCCPSGTKSLTAVSTHESLALCGKLTAEDPERDALYFEICSYPAHGTLTLNRDSGSFTYLAEEGFWGSDSFTWRVQDAHGAFAEPSTVTVNVRELTTGYLFSDIADSATHTAALLVNEAGLLDGEKIGKHHYFHPEKGVNRAAFVAILLSAAEVQFPEATETGYADDAEIPAGLKGAIRYAREQGWLGNEERFRPQDTVTRAEAAQIAAAVLGLKSPTYAETVLDFQQIPADVADAIYSIFEGGYISTMADGTLAPAAALTRGDAAKFFAKILDGKE